MVIHSSESLQSLKQRYFVLGMKVNQTSYVESVQLITQWAARGKSRYICFANVHMVMESHDSSEFREIINASDLVTPDGKPLSWILRSEQVCGRELTLQLCKAAQSRRISVGFYGSSSDVLENLVQQIQELCPSLEISYAYSPPFRSLTLEEQDSIIRDINKSGIKILFVGLGCPKQERWMSMNKSQLKVVMLGIGGAFDILAKAKPQVPNWMQTIGLEWLFRLCLEPRRLWHRNFWHSPRFILYFIIRCFIQWNLNSFKALLRIQH